MLKRIDQQAPVAALLNTVSARPVVVAGPSTTLTIPGIIVSHIVQALATSVPVTRIDVDLGYEFGAGLHRAPSLSAMLSEGANAKVTTYCAPKNARLRAQAFREWVTPDVGTVVAFAWPGLDNTWINKLLAASASVGATSIVVCASLPRSSHAKLAALAETIFTADRVFVGDEHDAKVLSKEFGPVGPLVEAHHALGLRGDAIENSIEQITAFLPRDNTEALTSLLAAFDAIPEAWIDNYRLHVAMRYEGSDVPNIVASSYYADNITLDGEDITSIDLEELCIASSALIIADPAFDSRAYSIAVDCGVALVVLASAKLPEVGHGYVGGLVADMNRPVSIHVALTHALRLGELRFPRPDAWVHLANRIVESSGDAVDSHESMNNA